MGYCTQPKNLSQIEHEIDMYKDAGADRLAT